MKIGEITPNQTVQGGVEAPREKRTESPEDFKTLFQGELSALSESAAGSRPEGEEIMDVASGVDMSAIWKAGAILRDMQATAATAQSVGAGLDSIGRVAGEVSSDLKRIDQAIGALSNEAESLREQVKDLPQNHPLRSVSDELSVLAYVESVKWKRGDYL